MPSRVQVGSVAPQSQPQRPGRDDPKTGRVRDRVPVSELDGADVAEPLTVSARLSDLVVAFAHEAWPEAPSSAPSSPDKLAPDEPNAAAIANTHFEEDGPARSQALPEVGEPEDAVLRVANDGRRKRVHVPFVSKKVQRVCRVSRGSSSRVRDLHTTAFRWTTPKSNRARALAGGRER